MSEHTDKLALTVAKITPATIMDTGDHGYYKTSEAGIDFDADTPFEVWEASVKSLASLYESSGKLHARTMFFLGDALNFGETAYGEEHAQAIDATRQYMQISMKTVENAARIAKRIEPSRRRENLTLAHYDAVYALPDRAEVDELLAKAETENMSVSSLKKEVKERHPKTTRDIPRKAIIDLESEEGLAHAAEKIAEWFQSEEKEINADKKRLRFKDWPINRKNLWLSLAELARIARNMGLTGQDKSRRR